MIRHSQMLRNTQVLFVQGKEPKERTREERENSRRERLFSMTGWTSEAPKRALVSASHIFGNDKQVVTYCLERPCTNHLWACQLFFCSN